VFYSFVRESNDDSVLGRCINNSVGRIATQLKMPFLHHSEFQGSPVLIGETEFVHPKNNKEEVVMKIFLASPKFDNAKMEADFGTHGPDFIQNVKNYVNNFTPAAFEEKVKANDGLLKVTLDKVPVTLKHREHFFFNARDRQL